MPKRLIQDVIAGKKPVTAASTTTVLDAARLMDKSNVASILIVGEDGALEGIFTERDLLRRVVAVGIDPAKTTIGTVMTRNPFTISHGARMLDAARTMHECRIRHLPVIDGSRAVGVISIRDLLGPEMMESVREQDLRERIWNDV